MQQAEGLFLLKYKQSGEEEERQNYKNKPRQEKIMRVKINNTLHQFAELFFFFSCTAVSKYNFKGETRQNISVLNYHSRKRLKGKLCWGRG